MIATEFVKVKCNGRNLKKLHSIGFNAKLNEQHFLTLNEARNVSKNIQIECICMFCGKLFYQTIRRHDDIGIDFCYDKHCQQAYRELLFELKYGIGIKNPGQIKEVRDKVKATCLEKFNATSPFGSKDVIDKRTQNNLSKYGVVNVSQLNSVKEKVRDTVNERYGADCVFSSDYFKQNLPTFLKNKYNEDVINASQVSSIRKKINATLIANSEGTGKATSKEQKHIKDLVNGTLNYRIKYNDKNFYIDIVDLDKRIAYEIDGRGHFARMTSEDEFYAREAEREEAIYANNFKLIRFKFDLELPNDDVLIKIFDFCVKFILSNKENKVSVDITRDTITLNELKKLSEVIQF